MLKDFKSPGVVALILAVLGFGLTVARAGIEFSGFLQGADGVQVTLTDGASGQSSGWLKPGQSFQGHAVVASDARCVVLEKDGHRLELPLREAKIKDGRMIVRGSVVAGRAGQLPNVAVALFVGEETSFPLHPNLTLHLKVERRPDGNLLYRARFIERNEGREDVLAAPTVIARPDSPFALRIGDFGFEFSPQH